MMSSAFLKIFSLIFVTATLFGDSFCLECLQLDTGDLSGFDIGKYTGKYELVMGILNDSPLSYLNLNCNGAIVKQHPHPTGGVNVAVIFEEVGKETVMDTFLGHMNSSTDIYLTEIDGYHPTLQKWTDVYAKVLVATDDLLAFTMCIKNEDDTNDSDFTALIARKKGSTLPVSKVQENLPDSIKNNPGLAPLCDN